jgi:uncharacterized membrane protein YfcA
MSQPMRRACTATMRAQRPAHTLTMTPELFILLPLTFVAAMLNASVGGGGLVLIPGLLTLYPSVTPASLLATEKLASVVGQATAAQQYAKRMTLPWRLVLPTAALALCGAHLGARAIAVLPGQWIKPFVVVLLVLMLLYTWFRPDFGAQDAQRPVSQRDLARGLALGSAIGFYEGFFGPGAGSFLIFLFVRVFHFDFMRATACAKVVNMATNLGALAYFIPAGFVRFELAIPMMAAMMAGSYAGSHLAMRGGNLWLRRLFLVLVFSLLGKLISDILRS